jgi:hypothetical protein
MITEIHNAITEYKYNVKNNIPQELVTVIPHGDEDDCYMDHSKPTECPVEKEMNACTEEMLLNAEPIRTLNPILTPAQEKVKEYLKSNKVFSKFTEKLDAQNAIDKNDVTKRECTYCDKFVKKKHFNKHCQTLNHLEELKIHGLLPVRQILKKKKVSIQNNVEAKLDKLIDLLTKKTKQKKQN